MILHLDNEKVICLHNFKVNFGKHHVLKGIDHAGILFITSDRIVQGKIQRRRCQSF